MMDTAILDRATEALRILGLTVTVQKTPRQAVNVDADAWLRIEKDGQAVDYVVKVKRTVTPATLGAALLQMQQLAVAAGRQALLVTGHMTPPVGDRLQVFGQPFADGAGNAYITGPGFLVVVTGRKPEKATLPRPGRAFTTAGLKVMFALICDPGLAVAPYRTIAAAAGVALGAIPPVLAEMRQQNHLLVAGKKRRLNATRRLLDEWAQAYARALRAKTLFETYTTPHFADWLDWNPDPKQARWGGEPAAHLLVGYLKPAVLTIYADKLPTRLMLEQRLTVAGLQNKDHLVEVRKPFWGDTLRHGEQPNIVPPVLVYADLLAVGDARCIETAQMIYDGHLARLFPAG